MPVPLIALAPCALVAIFSAVYAYCQHDQRCEERAGYRKKLQRLEDRLAEKERQYKDLSARLGEKNRQVRELAAEIERLRRELELLRPLCV